MFSGLGLAGTSFDERPTIAGTSVEAAVAEAPVFKNDLREILPGHFIFYSFD